MTFVIRKNDSEKLLNSLSIKFLQVQSIRGSLRFSKLKFLLINLLPETADTLNILTRAGGGQCLRHMADRVRGLSQSYQWMSFTLYYTS
jgi:hypothetical protein